MSAAELRRAAETLRGRATTASPGPWVVEQNWIDLGVPDNTQTLRAADGLAVGDAYLHSSRERNSDYIATMHPGVGLALADWLDHEATIASEDEADGWEVGPRFPGLILARLINGGA